MSHYHINIAVTKEDVERIKAEFPEYLDKCGGLMISVMPDNDVELSPELANIIRNLFVQLITTIGRGQFQGLN